MGFSHYEVAQRWIKGKKAKGKNMFTDGITIWSFGYHFAIAHKLKNNRVLFNTDHYSITTEKHKRIVSSACSMLEKIECSTKDIDRVIDFTDEIIIIQREKLPTDFYTIMNCLRDYCKSKGVKYFPMKKLSKEIGKLVFMAGL